MYLRLLFTFLFIGLSSNSYALKLKLSVDGLKDGLKKVTEELENKTSDSENSEDNKAEVNNQIEQIINIEFPYVFNLKPKQKSENCGDVNAKYTFYKNYNFELIYSCPNGSGDTSYTGIWKNISNSRDFNEILTTYDFNGKTYNDTLLFSGNSVEIFWNSKKNVDPGFFHKITSKGALNNVVEVISKTDTSIIDVNFPFTLNLEGQWAEGCGTPSLKMTFSSDLSLEFIYLCPEDPKTTPYKGKWSNISDDPKEFDNISFDYEYEGKTYSNELRNDIYSVYIYWNGSNTSDDWRKSEVDNVAKFLQKEDTITSNVDKEIDKSQGGYKDFYFDMNISQINQEIKKICPEQEFTNENPFSSENFDFWYADFCIKFGGENKSIKFYPNNNETIDKIILMNIDISFDSINYATYFTKDESGFVKYDEIVGKIVGSDRFELVRYPTALEVENFNSFDDLKILTGDAVMNTIVRNKETKNLVFLQIRRTKPNNYGYEFDLIYLSPSASASVIEDEKGKEISDDDF